MNRLLLITIALTLITVTLIESKVIPELKAEVLCKKVGYFRNPYDCSLYYRCYVDEFGRMILFDYRDRPCSPGLIFDEKQEVCAFPYTTSECHTIDA